MHTLRLGQTVRKHSDRSRAGSGTMMSTERANIDWLWSVRKRSRLGARQAGPCGRSGDRPVSFGSFGMGRAGTAWHCQRLGAGGVGAARDETVVRGQRERAAETGSGEVKDGCHVLWGVVLTVR